MIHKVIKQREFRIDVFGPVIVGEYHFTIRHDLDGLLSADLFHSLTNGVGKMKTFNIAREIASFTAGEIHKLAINFTTPHDYFQQIRELTPKLNTKFGLKK